jgi:glycosyl transferase family 25
MFFNYFESCFYINLKNRIDRKQSFESQFKNINTFIPRFEAILLEKNDPILQNKYNNFKIGCSLSHINLIKLAKRSEWKNVLIFEDDAIFCDNFLEKIDKCINDLKNINWDIFYLGGETNIECLKQTDNLDYCPQNGGIYGTHAYAVNNNFYDRIINLNPIQNSCIDVLYLHQINRDYLISKEILVKQNKNLKSDLW